MSTNKHRTMKEQFVWSNTNWPTLKQQFLVLLLTGLHSHDKERKQLGHKRQRSLKMAAEVLVFRHPFSCLYINSFVHGILNFAWRLKVYEISET